MNVNEIEQLMSRCMDESSKLCDEMRKQDEGSSKKLMKKDHDQLQKFIMSILRYKVHLQTRTDY